MPYIFNPPIVYKNPAILPTTTGVQYRLFRYYGPYAVGESVVGPYPTYRTVAHPLQDTLTGVDGVDYFLGGHVYIVSDAVGTALQGSGYGGFLTTTTWEELEGYTWGSLGLWEDPI